MFYRNYFFSSVLTSALLVSSPVLAESQKSTSSITQSIEQSDTWLQAKLVTTYALNRHLSLWDFDVDVRDQVAYLTGEVASSVDKSLAEEVADSIEGIKEVDNKIVVNEALKKTTSTTKDRSFAQQIEDLTTTASIKSKLLVNPDTDGLQVSVSTMNGTVTLEGTADSETEKDLIGQIAQNTDDVKEVVNKLTVAQG